MTTEGAGFKVRVVRLAVVFAAGIAAFVVLLTAVYALPQEPITANVGKSMPRLEAEGLYPSPVTDHLAYSLDNYTDALMIDTAIPNEGDGAFKAAMAARNAGAREPAATISGLRDTLAGQRGEGNMYAYYWHGYQVFLRPALSVFNVAQIRWLNIILLGGLLLGTLLYMHPRAGTRITAAYGLSLMAVGVFVVPMSLQFSSVFYLALAATIAVVGLRARRKLPEIDLELFFAVGMLVAFFDLLTAPLLTLGLPLAVLLAVDARRPTEGFALRGSAISAFKLSVAWAVGYVLSWATKWVLATVVVGRDYIGLALKQILFRTSMDGAPSAVVPAVSRTIADLFPFVYEEPEVIAGWFLMGVIVAVVAAALYLAARKDGMSKHDLDHVRRAASVLLVVPLPYLWIVLANNHTAIHHWFVYRIHAPAIFAVLFFLMSLRGAERPRGSSVQADTKRPDTGKSRQEGR